MIKSGHWNQKVPYKDVDRGNLLRSFCHWNLLQQTEIQVIWFVDLEICIDLPSVGPCLIFCPGREIIFSGVWFKVLKILLHEIGKVIYFDENMEDFGSNFSSVSLYHQVHSIYFESCQIEDRPLHYSVHLSNHVYYRCCVWCYCFTFIWFVWKSSWFVSFEKRIAPPILSVQYQATQSAITCSKLTIATLEQGLKYVQS